MMDKIVVDANCYKYYIDGSVRGTVDIYSAAFAHIFSKVHIALDNEKLILSEWLGCCTESREYASEMLDRLLLEDKIRLYPFVRNPHVRKALIEEGIPKNDARLVEFSVEIKNEVVVSEDIDLYDPKRKGCTATQRSKLLSERRGSACAMIRKKFRIEIITCAHVVDFV